jgi:predicted tellurium resistance membrane protein TerC
MPLLEFLQTEHIASYLTLTFLEIVLAGDNLVLIAILAGRLPERQRPLARRIGLFAAVSTRLLLLFSLFWISHLETALPVPGLPALTVTPRQLVFGIGGIFLILKAMSEIRAILGAAPALIDPRVRPWRGFFALTILQIALFDVIFSLDSVIAAIGIAKHIEVMVAAILTATLVMVVLVNPISNFIDRHQTVKLVALNFLILIGALLVAEAVEIEVPRAYFYAALGLAIVTQIAFLWLRAMRPGARIAVGVLVLALAGTIAASRNLDLAPVIGEPAATTLRNTIESAADALRTATDWLQRQLAKA